MRHVLLPPRRRRSSARAASRATRCRTGRRKFGFGSTTGIDIVGEDPGLLPDPAWKTKFYKENFSDQSKPSYDPNWLFDSSWNAADEINLSIGQGNLNVTPLQLAVGYAAIANGGTVVTPHVVSAIQAPDEPTRIQPSPPRRRIDIGEHAAQRRFAADLQRATHQPAGTATNVFGQFEIPVAGKTGTAQRVGEPDYAVFASYAPADDPQLVTVDRDRARRPRRRRRRAHRARLLLQVLQGQAAERRHRRGQVHLMSSVLIPGERVRARELRRTRRVSAFGRVRRLDWLMLFAIAGVAALGLDVIGTGAGGDSFVVTPADLPGSRRDRARASSRSSTSSASGASSGCSTSARSDSSRSSSCSASRPADRGAGSSSRSSSSSPPSSASSRCCWRWRP